MIDWDRAISSARHPTPFIHADGGGKLIQCFFPPTRPSVNRQQKLTRLLTRVHTAARRLIFLPTGAYLRLKQRQQTKTYTRRWGDVTRNPVAYSAASRMNVFPPACGTPVLRVVQPNTSGEKMRRVSTLSFGRGKYAVRSSFIYFLFFSLFFFFIGRKKIQDAG